MNANSASPEAAFGAHTVHTETGPFVWATLTACWSCEHPMLLWEATGTRAGDQYQAAPALEVKSEIRLKRYENHPDVHKAVNKVDPGHPLRHRKSCRQDASKQDEGL